jgi:hypothetical protein
VVKKVVVVLAVEQQAVKVGNLLLIPTVKKC